MEIPPMLMEWKEGVSVFCPLKFSCRIQSHSFSTTNTDVDTDTVTDSVNDTATDTDTITVTDTMTDPDNNTFTNTNTFINTDTDTVTDTDTNTVTDTDTDTNTITVTNTYTFINTDTDTVTDTDTNTVTDTDTVTDTNTDIVTDTNTDTGTNTSTDTFGNTDSDTNTNTSTDTDIVTDTNTDTGTNTETISDTNIINKDIIDKARKHCGGFYFPIKRMDIERLTGANGRMSNGTLVAELSLVLLNGRPLPFPVNFKLIEHEHFTVNALGEIRANGDIEPEAQHESFTLNVVAGVKNLPTLATTQINLQIKKSDETRCETSPRMCFAGTTEFQVHLDAKGLTDEVPLGPVGQVYDDCSKKIEYALDPGELRVALKNGTLLANTSALDSAKKKFEVNVSCAVDGVSTSTMTFYISTIPRTSAEVMPKKTTIVISQNVTKGEGFILAWAFFKEGASAELIQVQNSSLYSLTIERNVISSIFATRTLYIISLKWLKTQKIASMKKITAQLQVEEPGFSREVKKIVVNFEVTSKSLLAYPKQINLLRGLGPFARAAFPIGVRNLWYNLTNNGSDNSLPIRNMTFRTVMPYDLTSPFNVTPAGGIVYLTKRWQGFEQYFLNFTGVLIEWRLKSKNQEDLVHFAWIPIVWSQNKSPCHSNVTLEPCSVSLWNKTCQTTCGIAASASTGGLCSWVSPPKPYQYSTCTTDKNFCPDQWCDPLEELDQHICPQDCTTRVDAGLVDPKGQGIGKLSKGVCTCDLLGYCHCGHLAALVRDVNSPRRRSREDVPVTRASCDSTCVLFLLVTGSGVAVLIVVVSALICKKTRPSCTKNKSAMNYNIAYGGDTLILSEMAMMDHHQQIEIDEKWEILRDNLTVEECLGEGEFGRVLKATAKDLRNLPGE
ncbi:proto-oncogene tyrosine-protein kinase receptor Ret-like [Nesidiocoris tenuis]|uniref:Proto-oncogene tyrosine-protein kinase receptor Ret-like n=1 Tax=Nesidiocoris tenuis TaxID=355587 RepID=A0ABN7AL67_9HEMI|nr:proto-oncogene tyrosine-protein kinase receptor Ret-like [Nesidiocoris tenuis]